MDDVLLYIRLVLHIVTFSWLVSYRCTETSRPFVSLLAASLAGLSLGAAAHIVIMRPGSHQVIALVLTAACCIAVVRCQGNLARVFRWRADA